MRLKLYRASTVPEAMAQVRRELGPDALILSTRRTATGIELTAALEPADDFPPVHAAVPGPPPLARTLQWHGIPEPIVDRLMLGPLEATLGNLLRFAPLPLGPNDAPLLLTGPPGAGKTLTVARLATRLVLAGQSPLVITADGRRAGAAEELAAYTRLLGINLVVASHPTTLARAIRHRPAGAPVLVDSAGISLFDPSQVELIQALADAISATRLLVLPAGQDALETAEQAACCAEAGVRHFVPTRLDIARRLGGVVVAAVVGSMLLSEAGTGSGATDGLSPLTPHFLAERLALQGARPGTAQAAPKPPPSHQQATRPDAFHAFA